MDHLAFRRQMPVAQHYIYLNHAGVSPITAPAARAMADHNQDVLHNGLVNMRDWLAVYGQARRDAAALLGARAAEIAFIKNTSEGVSMVANGLGLGQGDVVVSPAGEFPANHHAWKRQEAAGAKLVVVQGRAGQPTEDELIQACRAHPTRVLALSWVAFHTGYRYDLDRLGAFCREHDIFLFVDGIQGVGALALDVHAAGVCGLAADSHKWMLGPEGAGILFVDHAWQDSVEPTELGWANMANPIDFFNLDQDLAGTARRYECGAPSGCLLHGLAATLQVLHSHGVDAIEDRILRLAGQLWTAARERGHETILPAPPRAGIVNLRPRGDGEALHQALLEIKAVHTWRNGWLRLSPHAYNTEEELEQVIGLL